MLAKVGFDSGIESSVRSTVLVFVCCGAFSDVAGLVGFGATLCLVGLATFVGKTDTSRPMSLFSSFQ